MSTHCDVLIIGGGTAGISVAARLAMADDRLRIGIIEPSAKHYYQPLWTLVGGGVFDKSITERDEADLIPDGVTWIRDRATTFAPDDHAVDTAQSGRLTYDQLVVAAGIQLNWGAIEGLEGNVGTGGICSNYSFQTVDSTWENIRSFSGGNAVFTFPATPIKCAGAPQKILWLAEHHFERTGTRNKSKVIYGNAGGGIFGIKRYATALQGLADKRGVIAHHRNNLVAVDAQAQKATFKNLDTGVEQVIDYDMLHVTPPQSAPTFIAESPLANAAGWVDVDMYTTQHSRYPDVFSLGDCSSLPCSKTGAAIRKQAPVTAANILAHRANRPLPMAYDGYASCPLVTGYGRLILAEFGYGGKIMETFPWAQNRERYSMFALKAYMLPEMYWHGMLRGRM